MGSGPRSCFRPSLNREPADAVATFAEAVASSPGRARGPSARTMIGDFLGLHRDDLEAIGKRCIDARNAREASTREVRSRTYWHDAAEACSTGREARGRPTRRIAWVRTTDRAVRAQPDWAADRLLQTSTDPRATIGGCSLVRGEPRLCRRGSHGDRSSRVHPMPVGSDAVARRFPLPRDAILPIEHTMNFRPSALPSFSFSGPTIARSMCAASGPPWNGRNAARNKNPMPSGAATSGLGRLPP